MTLIIRRQHIEALAPLATDALVATIDAHFADHHPELMQDLSLAERRQRILFGIERARHHGLTQERSIATFVRYTLMAWPDFEKDTHVAELLVEVSRAPNPDARFVLFDMDLARAQGKS